MNDYLRIGNARVMTGAVLVEMFGRVQSNKLGDVKPSKWYVLKVADDNSMGGKWTFAEKTFNTKAAAEAFAETFSD